MKKLINCLIVLTILVSSCQKGNNLAPNKSTDLADSKAVQPTASFNISNRVSDDLLLEGTVLIFDNKSINADSYFWDFGNGSYSKDEIPNNISFSPCGGTYTIKLTVKSKSAEVSVYSQTFTILCSGKHPYNAG